MSESSIEQQSDIQMKYSYGIVSKILMKDRNVSIQAKAIYALLCTYAGSDRTAFPSVNLIIADLGINRDTYFKHAKQLKDAGYIEVTQVSGVGGKFKKNLYTILPSPNLPDTVNPAPVNPAPVKRDTNSTNINNTNSNSTSLNTHVEPSKKADLPKEREKDIQEVYDYFIKCFKKNPKTFRLSPHRKTKIGARLTDAGKDMILLAIEKTSKSSFHMGHNERKWKAGLDYIVRSYEKVEGLANLELGNVRLERQPTKKVKTPKAVKLAEVKLTPEEKEKNRIILSLLREKKVTVGDMPRLKQQSIEYLKSL